jgi:hypothetical protein
VSTHPTIVTPTEIVIDGETGLLVSDEQEMARAIDHMGAIDPARCRASVAERHDIAVTAISDELVYRRAVGVQATLAPHRAATPTLRTARADDRRCSAEGTLLGRATELLGSHWPVLATAAIALSINESRDGHEHDTCSP